MSDIIQSYIKEVNKDVMFYFMDISSYGKEISFAEEYKSSNCRVINGMSDNVLKFITT